MSAVYSIRVDDALDTKLDFLVEKTGHKKSSLASDQDHKLFR